jgi:hypothetical protein
MTHPVQVADVKLLNISVTGVALIRGQTIQWPSPGDIIEGLLIMENRSFPIRIKIAHLSKDIVGGSFEPDAKLAQAQAAIRSFFSVELTALCTMKVDPKYHKKDPDGDAHWIHGDNADLFYVTKGTTLVRFRMTFLGNHYEGGDDLPLTIGLVAGGERDGDEMRKGSELVNEMKTTPDMIELGKKFLKSIPHLAPEHRKSILDFLSE